MLFDQVFISWLSCSNVQLKPFIMYVNLTSSRARGFIFLTQTSANRMTCNNVELFIIYHLTTNDRVTFNTIHFFTFKKIKIIKIKHMF